MRRDFIACRGINNKPMELGIETLGSLNIPLMCSTGAFKGVGAKRSVTNTLCKSVKRGWDWIWN